MNGRMRWAISLSFTISSAALSFSATGFAQEAFIAGTTPSVRPANAPVIQQVTKSNDWYASALHGVDKPYPASLRFLEDQGNWFIPFIHAGMTGRFDIRGWHPEADRVLK
jgi:hypothetical protein